MRALSFRVPEDPGEDHRDGRQLRNHHQGRAPGQDGTLGPEQRQMPERPDHPDQAACRQAVEVLELPWK